MNISFTDHAKVRLKEIHRLSSEYNGRDAEHTGVLLRLVAKHNSEIKKLYTEKDDHFPIEVGDLLILCMEILLEQGQDLDAVLSECYGRYENKLKGLIAKSGKR